MAHMVNSSRGISNDEVSTLPRIDGDLKSCYCYVCDGMKLAVQCEDGEWRCVECRSSCVECIGHGDASSSAPPPPSARSSIEASRRNAHARRNRFRMRPRGWRPDGYQMIEADGDERLTHHIGVICNGCGVRDFSGTRFRCLSCANYDLCSACHGVVDEIHPGHPFETIQTARPSQVVQSFAPPTLQTVVAIIEIGIEGIGETGTGLTDPDVAWWLAQDQCLVDEEALMKIDSSWSCPICAEGLDALDENGWVVSICGSSTKKNPDGETCATPDADADALEGDTDASLALETKPETASWTELQALEYAALRNRAMSGGATSDEVESVDKQKDPKAALIDLISKLQFQFDLPTVQRSQTPIAKVPPTQLQKDSHTAGAISNSHIFHEGCLRRWLLKKNSCPVCRRTPIVPEAVPPFSF